MANTQVTDPIDHTNTPDGIDHGHIDPSHQLLAEAAYTPNVTTDGPEPANPSRASPHANETVDEQPEMPRQNDPTTEDRETSSSDVSQMLTSASDIIGQNALRAASDQEIGIGTKRKFSSDKDDISTPSGGILPEPPSYTRSPVDAEPVAHELRPQQRQKRHHDKAETHEAQAFVCRLTESAVEVKISIPVITSGAMGCPTSLPTINAVLEVKFVCPEVDTILERWGTDEFLVRLVDGSTIWSPRYALPGGMVHKFELTYYGLDRGTTVRKYRFKGRELQYYVTWEGRPTTEGVWVDRDLISYQLSRACANNLKYPEDLVEYHQE